jgi:hypothetical protein
MPSGNMEYFDKTAVIVGAGAPFVRPSWEFYVMSDLYHAYVSAGSHSNPSHLTIQRI